MSVTWRTAWRATPPQVRVTTYQPAGSALGNCIQYPPSGYGCTRRLPLSVRGNPVVATGALEVARVQSGADEIARHAEIAAFMLARRWTVTGSVPGAGFWFPLSSWGRSTTRPNAARSVVLASTIGRPKDTKMSEGSVAAVSKRNTASAASTWPVPASGSPWRTVTVYRPPFAKGDAGTKAIVLPAASKRPSVAGMMAK